MDMSKKCQICRHSIIDKLGRVLMDGYMVTVDTILGEHDILVCEECLSSLGCKVIKKNKIISKQKRF